VVFAVVQFALVIEVILVTEFKRVGIVLTTLGSTPRTATLECRAYYRESLDFPTFN